MPLNEKIVRHMAKLAALALSDEEISKRKDELDELLSYVAKLDSVSTIGVVPTSHAHGAINAFRDDIIKISLPVGQVVSNAPDFVKGGFRVPKIIS